VYSFWQGLPSDTMTLTLWPLILVLTYFSKTLTLVITFDWLIIYCFVTFDWLIIYCFMSRSRIFHLYGDITIASKGLQNVGLCSALRAFEQGGIFIMPHLLWHRTSVFPVSSEGLWNFWLVGDQVGLSYFICVFLLARPSIWYHDPLTFDLGIDLLFKNFNLGHNFCLVGGRAFIFYMCIPSGKTFHLIPWPWLTDIWPLRKL
jgi:hypothetical protein